MANTQLHRSLGLFSLIALGVSGVIGSSWIYTNGTFFDTYGAGGMIFGLALGTLLAACVALSYAKLTTLFPRAGGEVVFGYTVLGRGVGFLVGWLLIGAYISSLAFYFTAFGILLGRVFPFMDSLPLYSIAGQQVTAPVLLCGLGITLLFFCFNVFRVSIGAKVQTVFFAILIFIGLCLAFVGFSQGTVDNFLPAFHPDDNPLTHTLRFVVPGMTYMAGFGLVATLAEEAKLSPKTIGRLVVITVLLAGSFYCLVLLASAFILPWEEVATMEQGTITAFATAGHKWLSWGAYLIALLGLLTSFLGLYMATSRIVVAMARVELLPAALARLDHRHNTPKNALLFVMFITIALGWLGKAAVVWFLDTGGIYLGLVWVIVVGAHIRLRSIYPHLAPESRWSLVLPLCGAVGAVLVIALALVPGSGLSLVFPAEYLILGAWALLGAFFYLTNKKHTPSEQALHSLLGDYAHTLTQATEPDPKK
ncbi:MULTISPECIES: APC family permease [unclassified Corynebacterium]|uniref:APC family permease n=1 Tax=unclassified Corynebacterium TaxID=2624378 RepID=UPI001AEF5EB9|nr:MULTISPECIES: APC family permease [unclassified Corynebacterium]